MQEDKDIDAERDAKFKAWLQQKELRDKGLEVLPMI